MEKEIKKDLPSRLHARHQMLKVLYTVKEVPTKNAGKKRGTKELDLVAKLFDEIAPKYVGRINNLYILTYTCYCRTVSYRILPLQFQCTDLHCQDSHSEI